MFTALAHGQLSRFVEIRTAMATAPRGAMNFFGTLWAFDHMTRQWPQCKKRQWPEYGAKQHAVKHAAFGETDPKPYQNT
jgi:hypothetical protein